MTWLTEISGATPLERVLRKRPELFEYLQSSVTGAWSGETAEPVLLELCRLAIARTHNCRSELSIRTSEVREAGLTEKTIAALGSYESSELFSERERACLLLADQFAFDVHGVTDEARLSEIS